jgi:DNA repair protein RadB
MDAKLDAGCEMLTTFLDGGYESGVITSIYGPASSGKTTTCLLAVASAARTGKVIFIDTEGGFSVERMKQVAPDYERVLENVLILKPTTFEEQKKQIETLDAAVSKQVSLIVCDTISALYRVERGQDNGPLNTELGKQLGRLLAIARKNSIPAIVTNQVYADFEDKSQVRMVGGDIIAYNTKCLIELRIGRGSKREACLRKHRSLPERTVAFEITQEGLRSAPSP